MAVHFEYRVHPSVGIARMGNSATTYFLTAEKPGKWFDPVQESIPGPLIDQRAVGIRDAAGNLCKQGARFRVFCYQYDRNPGSGGKALNVWECKKADYDITWTAQVANRKAQVAGTPLGTAKQPNSPDPVVLPSSSASSLRIFTGKPAGRLDLGSCFVDADGRLVILGSDGKAKKIGAGGNEGKPESLFWAGFEDDAADGPITARVKPKAGSKQPDKGRPAEDAVGGWVVIGLPDYGADVRATVTLYDVAMNHAYEMAKKGKKMRPPQDLGQEPADLSKLITYYQQILPLLYAQHTVPYTIKHHRHRIPFPLLPYEKKNTRYKDFLRAAKQTDMITPEDIWAEYITAGSGEPKPAPAYRVQNPAILWTKNDSMPNLEYVAMTELQQRAVEKWSQGKLPMGDSKAETSAGDLYAPYQLDLAHMETMSGGSFYPGIEVGRQAHWPETWRGRTGCCPRHYDVRVTSEINDAGTRTGPAQPGYLTMFLACPWQADFIECSGIYWPHSRPIEVRLTAAGPWKKWMSDPGGDIQSHTAPAAAGGPVLGGLAEKWWMLGFVRYNSADKQLFEMHRSPGMAPKDA